MCQYTGLQNVTSNFNNGYPSVCFDPYHDVLIAGGLFPGACQIYVQSAMAEIKQNRTLLSSRGAGLPPKAGD